MDYLKTRAPFWKQVERADGKDWVAAKQSDESAAERWASSPPPSDSLPRKRGRVRVGEP
jgi:hypothetical protein